jgi:hypothetical protein
MMIGMKMYQTLYWCCWPVIVLSHLSNGIAVFQFRKKINVERKRPKELSVLSHDEVGPMPGMAAAGADAKPEKHVMPTTSVSSESPAPDGRRR